MQQPATDHPTAERQAYDLVKARIMDLTFRPGQNITDSEIAGELNISRTPIREAFRRLEYEGLLTGRPRRGWQVCPLTLEDIHEIFNIKQVLEGMIARQAAESNDRDLKQKLKDITDRMLQAGQANDLEAWEEIHHQWHETVFALSFSPRGRVFKITSNLNDQWHRVRFRLSAIEGRMAHNFNEHHNIAESILAGDGEEAERRMVEHLGHVRRELVNLLVNLVLPYSPDGV